MCDHDEIYGDLSNLGRQLAKEQRERLALEKRVAELEAKILSLSVDGEPNTIQNLQNHNSI